MTIVTSFETITSEAAHAAVKAALDKGKAMGLSLSAAVVDAGGHPLAFLRTAGMAFHSAQMAQWKAYSAMNFKAPTAAVAERFQGRPDIAAQIGKMDKLVFLGGGLPIKVDGKVVGGIGVSGGTPEQDVEAAAAALQAIGAQA